MSIYHPAMLTVPLVATRLEAMFASVNLVIRFVFVSYQRTDLQSHSKILSCSHLATHLVQISMNVQWIVVVQIIIIRIVWIFLVHTNVDVQLDFRWTVTVITYLLNFSPIYFLFVANYLQVFGNARNSSATCQPTDYSPLCRDQCTGLANCTTSGKCTCPSSLVVVNSVYSTKQTCHCPDHPLSFYNGSSCIRVIGKMNDWKDVQLVFHSMNWLGNENQAEDTTWFIMNLEPVSSRSVSRTLNLLNETESNNLKTSVIKYLIQDFAIDCFFLL